MLKLLWLIVLFTFSDKVAAQRVIYGDYSFIGRGIQTPTLRQCNDTIYQFNCYTYPGIPHRCLAKPSAYYKIISLISQAPFYVLKLERLDTIPLTSKPYPQTRYSLMILKIINNDELGYLPLRLGSTKIQIDTAQVNIAILRNNFYFTYFSNKYIKDLTRLKLISTKQQAQSIIEIIKGETFKEVIKKYQKTQPIDFYGSGMISELINRACIMEGYNPLNAQQKINDLLK
ncbi:hypothetical protein [Hymenobacter nivis]|uniref:hypothetical protein n=1 Tax=Hymenobacter nivis TaxID=1850093 RepID=UPI0013A58CA4|nr:hypothetical protein [Hymenobacter nivis]